MAFEIGCECGVVAAIVQKFTLSRPKNGLLQSFFTRKLPKMGIVVYCVKYLRTMFRSVSAVPLRDASLGTGGFRHGGYTLLG